MLGHGILALLQMSLEYLLGVLRLQHIKVTGQPLEVLAQLLIRDYSVELLVLSLIRIPLAAEHKSHLLLGHLVRARVHDLINELHRVDLLRHSECLGVLLVLHVSPERRLEGIYHLLGISGIVGAAQQVVADSLEIRGVGKVEDALERLDLHEQIHGLGLLMILHEVWDDDVDQEHQVVHAVSLLDSLIVLLTDFSGQASQILMSPLNEVLACPLKTVLQALIRALHTRHHPDHRHQVSELALYKYLVNNSKVL